MDGPITTIELGGCRWKPIETRILLLETELERHLREAGLYPMPAPQSGETADALAARVIRQLIDSRKFYILVGHLLLPADIPDTDWSIEHAERTGHFIERLTDETDKAIAKTILLNLVIGFFVAGLSSSEPTDTVLEATETQPAEVATERTGSGIGGPSAQ